jgi:hypothetical protein
MSSSHYMIKRWDPVITGSNHDKHPAIYIEVDTAFLEFSRNNQFTLTCVISGTNSIYDNYTVKGLVNESNILPNFSHQTGLYIITLINSDWYGYPNELGYVEFFGISP